MVRQMGETGWGGGAVGDARASVVHELNMAFLHFQKPPNRPEKRLHYPPPAPYCNLPSPTTPARFHLHPPSPTPLFLICLSHFSTTPIISLLSQKVRRLN